MYYTLQEDQHLNCLSAFDPKGHTQTVETILDHKIKKNLCQEHMIHFFMRIINVARIK